MDEEHKKVKATANVDFEVFQLKLNGENCRAEFRGRVLETGRALAFQKSVMF